MLLRAGKKIRQVLVSSLILSFSFNTAALDINGVGDRTGIVALYLFDETSGDILDVSGYDTPLNLRIDIPGAAIREPGAITLNSANLIRSIGPATKITRDCKISNELTVEAWIQNLDRDPARDMDGSKFEDGTPLQPVRIVTLGSDIDTNNFVLGQAYDGQPKYKGITRTSANSTMINDLGPIKNPIVSPEGSFAFDAYAPKTQHVIFTRDKLGVARLYLSDDFGRNMLKAEQGRDFGGTFANWQTDAVLGIGNEINYAVDLVSDNAQAAASSTNQNRAWRGKIFLMAIYCRALSEDEIVGSIGPNHATMPVVQPTLSSVDSPHLEKAKIIYRRLAGLKAPLDSPVLQAMATNVAQGKLLEAADIATRESSFYNITVRDFAARMSTRDETVNATLNDFTATVIGMVRDDLPGTDMLTGNYVYQADPTKAAVESDPVRDLLKSNRHYESLHTGRFDLSSVLKKVDGQKLISPSSVSDAPPSLVINPDAAGLLTTRAFMAAHAIAGTNRRLIEYSFREFACIPIEKWADSTGPDSYIGRDIDRFPGGVNQKFTSSCRSCHSGMDSLRGAFARYTFSGLSGFEYVKYAYNMPNGNEDDDEPDTMKQIPDKIAAKMNQNSDVFPGGYITTDDRWENVATRGANALFFGWPTDPKKLKGMGVRQFGQMLAESDAFPRCMATRVYRSVCKREPAAFDQTLIFNAATSFKAGGYNLRNLFKTVATSPECLGAEQWRIYVKH